MFALALRLDMGILPSLIAALSFTVFGADNPAIAVRLAGLVSGRHAASSASVE